MEKNIIIDNKNPNKHDDGYEWSENFDGKIFIELDIYYFNLKFVCDNGGSQTRTLREVYHFIKNQIIYLQNNINNINNIYFINILDGDTSYNNINKFYFLINKYKKLCPHNNKNICICNNIFIGDMRKFQFYMSSKLSKIYSVKEYTKSNDILLRDMSLLSL